MNVNVLADTRFECETQNDGSVVAWTDGASVCNQDARFRRAGCGVFLSIGDDRNRSFSLPGCDSRAEYLAAIAAMRVQDGNLETRSDSEFCLTVSLRDVDEAAQKHRGHSRPTQKTMMQPLDRTHVCCTRQADPCSTLEWKVKVPSCLSETPQDCASQTKTTIAGRLFGHSALRELFRVAFCVLECWIVGRGCWRGGCARTSMRWRK